MVLPSATSQRSAIRRNHCEETSECGGEMGRGYATRIGAGCGYLSDSSNVSTSSPFL